MVGVLILIMLLYTQTNSNNDDDYIQNTITNVHTYSGLNHQHYLNFVNYVTLFNNSYKYDTETAASHLYNSIGELAELSLYGDYDVQYDINIIIKEFAEYCELMLLKKSLKDGSYFSSLYLKDKLDY